MGRKVNPIGFRLKINQTWEGRWYAEGDEYVNNLHQDFHLRELVRDEAPKAGVSLVEIERFPGKVKVIVHTAKPGILIGRKGENVKKIRQSLEAWWARRSIWRSKRSNRRIWMLIWWRTISPSSSSAASATSGR